MKVLFLGTPSFAQPTLQTLLQSHHEVVAVLTRPDRPRGRHGTPSPSPVKRTALEHGIPVLQPERMRTRATFSAVRDLGADVGVVVAFGRLLSPAFLEIHPRGCVNLHASLLPAYRGAAPIQWAVALGETETGLTTMQVDEGLDTGDILLQRTVPIEPEESAADLAGRLAALGGPMMVETLDGLADGTLRPRPQPSEGISHAPLLRKEDGRIDWSAEAGRVAARVRGMQPWPVAHARSESGWIKVFRAGAVAGPPAAPGEVLGGEGDAALVACGGGSVLALREVQPESRKRMSGREALNGRALRPGEQLG